MSTKYIFVTGGVVSSIGKGITAASLGRLLKDRGLKVSIQKFDPYLNIDPGTMSPYQHGEVFVTDDGAETDLDLGHYERFIDENLTKNSNITTGKVYWSVISKERKGEYLGGTVQVIPHITNEIKSKVYEAAEESDADVIITEIGGTVGDIESQPFLEAIRQVKFEAGKENVCYIHVTLVPYLHKAGELKTKPTQHSVKELRSIGIQPDIIVCRTEKPLSDDLKSKIGLFCNIDGNSVVQNLDAENLYEVPLLLQREGLDSLVCDKLNLEARNINNEYWIKMVEEFEKLKDEVNIALVGKYVELHDAYISVVEALNHGGLANNVKVNINWINAEDINYKNVKDILGKSDGILVPGGFGDRGIEGKIEAIRWARENKVPFLGICLGMQCAVIEFARNVLGYEGANSSEIASSTKYPVIDLLPDQKNIEEVGGTMRLGAYPCALVNDSNAIKVYGKDMIKERHRHRYEFNNDYREKIVQGGLNITGTSPDGRLVEIIEIKDHPWFVGCQFHPELKSRPNNPHPLFVGFIKNAKKRTNR
ncbi:MULTISPECIES: CTP synthase [Clostridium]|uniref:CTP synthase n=1 Tax=Clostridium cadaveris TaxID=1529 RepID=A0A1I2LHN3_9CLOT|nr:CTP synthase [Clostridium cadaveris]MDM8310648.1 CTP synthase [Clostridium cadaveris]MDU4951378.1 CTP synthase [Clostridium sp.]UFH64310.1 CTP synthase [Clostridium cadaveris]SFF77970.1 CTP synthase [Clostridium cadaveris]